MRNWIYIFSFLFLALILQTTVIPSLFTSIGSFLHSELLVQQTINVAFLILIYICFSRPFFSGLFWFCIVILLQNSFDFPWRGSLALSYLLCLILIYIMETMFVFQYSLSTMLVIFSMVLLQNVFHLLLGGMAIGFEFPLHDEVGRLILFSLLNCLAAPFIFYGLYSIDSSTIFHFDKSKSFFGRRVGL